VTIDGNRLMTPRAAISFIKRHGVVLERANGPVPNLVEAIVGGPVRGSWWAHPDSHHIFIVLRAVQDSPEVLRCRLVDGKLTYAHRRVWPALVRLAASIGPRRLDRFSDEHTPSGAHRAVKTPFPQWVPADVLDEAKRLATTEDALRALRPFAP
jgi:hypothetical protein